MKYYNTVTRRRRQRAIVRLISRSCQAFHDIDFVNIFVLIMLLITIDNHFVVSDNKKINLSFACLISGRSRWLRGCSKIR